MVLAFDQTTILKLTISIIVGAIIGFERKIHNKPAGMRTHALVSLGACLFTIIALNTPGTQADSTSRIIQGVITGVGFLSAGIIFQSKHKIIGLTTAAEIWVLTSLGILIGMGYYDTAIISTILILILLVPLKQFEKKMRKTR